MRPEFSAAYACLKSVLIPHVKDLSIKTDSDNEFTLLTKSKSPFPQHKGQPMYFGSVRVGKAYVSFHLMPLYMCPALQKAVSPTLKKRMQGKTCFNFKTEPDQGLVDDLKELTAAAVENWKTRKWL